MLGEGMRFGIAPACCTILPFLRLFLGPSLAHINEIAIDIHPQTFQKTTQHVLYCILGWTAVMAIIFSVGYFPNSLDNFLSLPMLRLPSLALAYFAISLPFATLLGLFWLEAQLLSLCIGQAIDMVKEISEQNTTSNILQLRERVHELNRIMQKLYEHSQKIGKQWTSSLVCIAIAAVLGLGTQYMQMADTNHNTNIGSFGVFVGTYLSLALLIQAGSNCNAPCTKLADALAELHSLVPVSTATLESTQLHMQLQSMETRWHRRPVCFKVAGVQLNVELNQAIAAIIFPAVGAVIDNVDFSLFW